MVGTIAIARPFKIWPSKSPDFRSPFMFFPLKLGIVQTSLWLNGVTQIWLFCPSLENEYLIPPPLPTRRYVFFSLSYVDDKMKLKQCTGKLHDKKSLLTEFRFPKTYLPFKKIAILLKIAKSCKYPKYLLLYFPILSKMYIQN